MILRVKRDTFKKYSIVLAVFLGLFALVFLIPIYSALAATVQSFTVSLAIGNQNVSIVFIQTGISITPVDGGKINLSIIFNASDDNGFADINLSSAVITINQSGISRRSLSESCVQVDASGNILSINCTIHVSYFDSDGLWDVNISISDNVGTNAENTSNDISTTIGVLNAIQINPSSLSFGTSLTAGDTNIGATDDPLQVNNTGNQDYTTIQVAAINLAGLTTPSDMVLAGNFTVNTTDAIGTSMINATGVTIPGASVTAGNNSFEQLYFFIDALNNSLSPQTYDTSRHGQWNVSVS